MSYAAFVQNMQAKIFDAVVCKPEELKATPIDAEILNLVLKGADNCALVALTNVAATATDPEVETTLLTKEAGGLDFRSLYKKAARPVLIELASALSIAWVPSSDPFVSNPFREAQVDQAWVERRKNKLAGAAELKTILEYVSVHREEAQAILRTIAAKLIEKLEMSKVSYTLPPRLTTNFVSTLLADWLQATSSKGARLEHVTVAILRFAGLNLSNGWDEVVSHHVNDPRPYDALCNKEGKTIAVGECKDQPITTDHINQLSKEMANLGATRGYLFTRKEWISQSDISAIDEAIKTKSVFGYRIDVIEVMEATRTWLGLIDLNDAALPAFMAVLTAEMEVNGHLQDRRDLAASIDKMVSNA